MLKAVQWAFAQRFEKTRSEKVPEKNKFGHSTKSLKKVALYRVK